MVNPPAEYTAASEKPTIVPDMSATSAAMVDITSGRTISGQNGGRLRLSRLFARSVPASEGGGLSVLCNGAALSRYVVRLRRRVNEAQREQRKKIPTTRRSVQYRVKCQMPGVSGALRMSTCA